MLDFAVPTFFAVTPPPGCELPPVWEDGIVTCVEPRPEDGFWNEGDTCEYTCPGSIPGCVKKNLLNFTEPQFFF